ncbi:DNA mismatch repair endonuclease MutL [Fructobacillus sp. M1-13]|uniref:DNA mismatch repair protein MutL n=1 Tax=Fructobacillus papyriferae TaxID=2713171 RepID=A0ABS5QRC3_9LACO|nr:DNA mismatch repair endonuclease MutL [Fructobacillus papyriferae]MBS9334874.1 DNA mismatch repair endonuclease MutL [Fructobacillus papyriferae]MCD2158864.1 DNA mismatch repair endonuclease MutL [Fructobacillus papyriferae]
MAKIHELSDLIANQIAAGEVIERPASVVKELVENAIDANASQVDVVVDQAGLDLIKVIDNGQGIPGDQVPLAFVRHATSKIENRHDLFKVMTLGFRGEALPSIASVSDVTLQTKTADAENGFTYQVKGGQVVQESPAPGRLGTIVSVRNLFYNTPARLKYLKKPQTELSLIVDVVNHLALANPKTALTLTHNGKTLVKTAGNGDLRQVLAAIYDRKTAEKMVGFAGQSEHFKVSGYLTLPEQTRASRSYLAVLVNHRFVKNFSVSNAIIKGYGSKLMVGRFPIGAVSIELDPLMVDVNVHPQKAEIRLSEQGELTDLLTAVVANRLSEENLIPDALENLGQQSEELKHPGMAAPALDSVAEKSLSDSQGKLAGKKPSAGQFAAVNDSGLNASKRAIKLSELPAIAVDDQAVIQLTDKAYLQDAAVLVFAKRYQDEGFIEPFEEMEASGAVFEAEETAELGTVNPFESANKVAEPMATYEAASDAMITAEEPAAPAKKIKVENVDLDVDDQQEDINPQGFPKLDYIGQMHGTFLFAQDKDKLYLIDQHAAQERLNYEFYRKQVGEVSDNQQVLLQPLMLNYSTADVLKILDVKELLAEVGLAIEEFGPNTIALYEHPTWMKADQLSDTVKEMIDWILSGEKLTVAAFREKAAIMMSCKRAIKANWHISDDEARRLLADLAKAENPYNCPHGRPVLTAFTLTEMERMFKRIQDSHESWQNYDTHPF